MNTGKSSGTYTKMNFKLTRSTKTITLKVNTIPIAEIVFDEVYHVTYLFYVSKITETKFDNFDFAVRYVENKFKRYFNKISKV